MYNIYFIQNIVLTYENLFSLKKKLYAVFDDKRKNNCIENNTFMYNYKNDIYLQKYCYEKIINP